MKTPWSTTFDIYEVHAHPPKHQPYKMNYGVQHTCTVGGRNIFPLTAGMPPNLERQGLMQKKDVFEGKTMTKKSRFLRMPPKYVDICLKTCIL
jgi:hypothetical protein